MADESPRVEQDLAKWEAAEIADEYYQSKEKHSE